MTLEAKGGALKIRRTIIVYESDFGAHTLVRMWLSYEPWWKRPFLKVWYRWKLRGFSRVEFK